MTCNIIYLKKIANCLISAMFQGWTLESLVKRSLIIYFELTVSFEWISTVNMFLKYIFWLARHIVYPP